MYDRISTSFLLVLLVPRLVCMTGMETIEIKREIELLSDRLGKTQDYL